MLRASIRWTLNLEGLRCWRDRWVHAALSLQARVILSAPVVSEAFVAWAAGLGNAVVAGIICSHAVNGARQWAAGTGALVPVRHWGRLR
jgi:hypothetical protein